MSPGMSLNHFMGYTRPTGPIQPTPQIAGRSPSASPPSRTCCENGQPIVTDPHTGQTICSCQYPASLVAFPRVPGLPEGVYAPPFTHHQGLVPVGSDASAFYSPLGNAPYDLKENVEAWRTLQQAGGCFTYDPSMTLYPYPGYGGLDLNGARRKNATRETTTTLKHWLYEHRKNPYPTKGEKIMLAIITKMTLTQVSTWFANARRRLKKENKMTWTPRNRAEDGLENGNNDESDIDIDDDLDDEDKEKLKRAGLLSSPSDDKLNEKLEDNDMDDIVDDMRGNESCGRSSRLHQHVTSAENSPIDMRKSPDEALHSDYGDSEPEVKRRKSCVDDLRDDDIEIHHKRHNNDVDLRSDADDVNSVTSDESRVLNQSNNCTLNASSAGQPQTTATRKIWSVSEFLNNTSSSDSPRRETSPVITTQVQSQSISSHATMRPHCGVTLVPSPHGWIGCRLPIGYPLPPHSLQYQYALKQHLLSRSITANKPSTFVSQADLLRRGAPPSSLFSPARDLDTLRSRFLIDKSSAPVVI